MDGAEPSANGQNISDIPDGAQPSRPFSRMRKTRSFHYAFDKIVDHDVTGTETVYRIRWTSRPSSEDKWESIWNIPYNAVAAYQCRNGLDSPPCLQGIWTEVTCLCEHLLSSRVNPVFDVKGGGWGPLSHFPHWSKIWISRRTVKTPFYLHGC